LDVADLDGDGLKDIVMMLTAVTNRTSGPPWRYKSQVRLLHGNGRGTFETSVITDLPGVYGYGAVAADLNNDGSPDLLLREQLKTHVLLNDGHGIFRESWTGTPGYYGVTTLDANRDGFLDLVSGTQTGHGGLIELFINDGSGTRFTKTWESALYGSGYDSINSLITLDLNGDSYPDLASREIYGGRLITPLGSDGTLPFVPNSVTGLGDRTFALAGGDLNGDGRDDVVTYVGWGQVKVFMNQGNGSLSNSWQSLSLDSAAFNLALADFDGDGAKDIFVGAFGGGRLQILRNMGKAQFAAWWEGTVRGEGYIGTTADLNGDRMPDLIVGGEHDLRVLLNLTGKPEIGSVRPSLEGATVTVRVIPGRQYQLQFKERMDDLAWKETGGVVTATNTTEEWTDVGAASANQRFYQVMEVTE
jgi:hypothetical protein